MADMMHEGMDDSLYGESSKPMSKSKSPPESIDEEEAEHPTALLDLKILTGKDGVKPKVGEERVVKITAIHGDEAEVMYAPEKPDEEEEHEEPDEANDNPAAINSRYSLLWQFYFATTIR